MQIQQRRGIGGPIAFFLAILLIVLVVAAGFLWLREADARLQAEQKVAELQKKYDALKTQCDAMKNGGQVQGVALDVQQDPVVAGLESQADVPQCEKPTIQPFAETMRAQDPTFFNGAKKGDVLVSYPLSKMVYLYRPSTQQLLNQARIADTPQQPQPMSPSFSL